MNAKLRFYLIPGASACTTGLYAGEAKILVNYEEEARLFGVAN